MSLDVSNKAVVYNNFLLIVIVSIAFYIGLGHFPLFDLDEGAFSSATMDMILRDDWITPYLNGVLRADKPVLIYWCQRISVAIFGLNEFGLRLPSALAASFWIFSIFRFACDYSKPNVWQTTIIAAFSLFTLIVGRAATADALLNLFITLTCFSIWRYLQSPSNKLAYITYLWMGLGFLSKGPVAVIIPFVLFSLYCASYKQWSDLRKAIFFFPGWVLFVLIAIPWYIAISLVHGPEFLTNFILGHNIGRFSSTMEGHGGSLFFYFPVLLFIALPFSGVLIKTLTHVKTLWREPLSRFLLIWFGFTFVLFSFSQTQLPHYLLYGIPPLWILMGKELEKNTQPKTILFPLIVFIVLLIALPSILSTSPAKVGSDGDYIISIANQHFGWGYYLQLLIALLFTGMLWFKGRSLSSLMLIPSAGIISFLLVLGVVLPILSDAQQAPVKEAALIAKEANKKVIMKEINMPSFSVYLGQPTFRSGEKEYDWVFTRTSKLYKFSSYKLIYQRGNISLIEIQP